MLSSSRGLLRATVLCSLLVLQVPVTEAFAAPGASLSLLRGSTLGPARAGSAQTCPRKSGATVATGVQMQQDSGERLQRRDAVRAGWLMGMLLGTATLLANPQGASAAKAAKDAERAAMLKLVVGLKGLTFLLANWEEETTLCNYAEVQRGLLESKNKQELLEAAKTNALFNKEVSMVIRCKRNPLAVREYLGLASDNHPLHNAVSAIAKFRKTVDPDSLEAYVEAEETYSRLVASADAMAYGAGGGGRGGGDFSANNEFAKGEKQDAKQSKLQEAARADVKQVRTALKTIVTLLGVLPPANVAPQEAAPEAVVL